MKIKQIEYSLTDDKIKSIDSAKNMSDEELSAWFAFCNSLKFINCGEQQYKESIDECDIPYSAILNYTRTVSGDILQFLKSRNGIPMKYSLDMRQKEEFNVEEIEMVL